MLAIPRSFLTVTGLGAFFVGAGLATAGELVVDGRLIRYEPFQGKNQAVSFQMESKGYQNTYLLDCPNQRFLWLENVDLRTGEATENNADADWKALNPRSTVANAVHREACLGPSDRQTAAAEETSPRDQLPLRQGMRYSQAREIILDAGWQASRKPVQEVPEFGVVNELYVENGWQEISDCAGSGTMPCRFEFRDMHNRLLVVITEGECLSGTEPVPCDLAVSRWYLQQPSGAASHRAVLEQSQNAGWKTNQSVESLGDWPLMRLPH